MYISPKHKSAIAFNINRNISSYLQNPYLDSGSYFINVPSIYLIVLIKQKCYPNVNYYS